MIQLKNPQWVQFVKFQIENVIIDDEKRKARLVSTEGSELELRMVGDCCSKSYFEENSIEALKGLFSKTLVSVLEVGSKREPVRNAEDDTTKYGCLHLITTDGVEVIDWRNESNGYYHGECEIWVDESVKVAANPLSEKEMERKRESTRAWVESKAIERVLKEQHAEFLAAPLDENEHHVKVHGDVAYCGAKAEGWAFVDAIHARNSVLAGSYTQPCPKCWAVITNAPVADLIRPV